jgi:hypothetical protein
VQKLGSISSSRKIHEMITPRSTKNCEEKKEEELRKERKGRIRRRNIPTPDLYLGGLRYDAEVMEE